VAPIDRALILKNAEKLIRQGKLDGAIAEFVRLVEDQPSDWNAKNSLGDLYARAGQVDKAVEQFIEIANNLNDEGAVAKAGAVYKKILKLKPDHEHALVQVADILGSQGLYADARGHLNTLVELRRAKGDVRGALSAKIRLGSLDPEDYEGRLGAADARIEMRDVGGAMSDLKEIAAELSEKGRQPEAIEVLRKAATLNPDDEEIREKLLDVFLAAGELAQARECATTVEQFKTVSAAFEAQGNADEALATMRQASTLNPADTALQAQLAKMFIARGDLATAAEYLTAETAGDDPALLMTVADIQLRGDKFEDGMAIVRRLLEEDPSRREEIALLGWNVGEQHPDAGFQVVELAADTAVTQGDWPGAAAVLQEFVTRVPNHIPALMHLVEICVDGGLEATMYGAQGQLADAYLATGAATEARFIAEDLVAREPWEAANIERFRRALVMLGETDPEGLIAERLSGESPFTSTDLSFNATDLFPTGETAADGQSSTDKLNHPSADPMADAFMADDTIERPAPKRALSEERQFGLSASGFEFESFLKELESLPPELPPKPEIAVPEVDLSVVLEDIRQGAAPAKPLNVAEPDDLDGVFGNMRTQSSKRSGLDDAEKEYKRGLTLRAAGDIDGCIAALATASRAPKLRFATARMIARLYRDRNMLPQALEWLERASQAPAPTSDDGHQLLYELADMLEKAGESARALAVCMELQSEAGAYLDVAARIDRLTKVQAGG
jgi:tetratricopeptide (TPR) repeat protein